MTVPYVGCRNGSVGKPATASAARTPASSRIAPIAVNAGSHSGWSPSAMSTSSPPGMYPTVPRVQLRRPSDRRPNAPPARPNPASFPCTNPKARSARVNRHPDAPPTRRAPSRRSVARTAATAAGVRGVQIDREPRRAARSGARVRPASDERHTSARPKPTTTRVDGGGSRRAPPLSPPPRTRTRASNVNPGLASLAGHAQASHSPSRVHARPLS